MFTWNLQYVSKTRLSDSLKQLMIDYGKSDDILIRIHTSIHAPDDAVELAAFIKKLVPRAHIFGTSTSAVVNGGKVLHDQCVISITQMAEGSVSKVRVPVFDTQTENNTVTLNNFGNNKKRTSFNDLNSLYVRT